MSTKTMLGCLLLLIVVGYSSACMSQNDCPVTHCCAKKAFVEGEYNCVRYRQKNEMCLDGGLDEILYDDVFDINCPCQPGLTCIKQETTDGRGGFIAIGNPMCRDLIEERIRWQSRTQANSIARGGAGSSANGRRE